MTINEAADILSKEIIDVAKLCANEMKKNYKKLLSKQEKIAFVGRKISFKQEIAMFYLFAFLFFHLTERRAYHFLNYEKRIGLMVALLEKFSEAPFTTKNQEGINKYRENIIKGYDDFFDRYKHCKKIRGENGTIGEAGTLLWEFGKEIAYTIGQSLDRRYIIFSVELVIGILEYLCTDVNIDGILEKIE